MPNRVRFDGRTRHFYEVWYTIFNHVPSGDGFWIRYTLLNPIDQHPQAGAGLWFGYTCRSDPARSFAVHRTFSEGSFEAKPGADALRIGDASLGPGFFLGGFEAAGHSLRWDLRYDPTGEPHYFFRGLLGRLTEARNSVTIPHPRIQLSGLVEIDGQKIEIRHAPGHQAHHWGVRRAPRWNWGHCCEFEGEEGVLELLSGEGPGGVVATFVNLYTPEERFLTDAYGAIFLNRCVSGLGFWRFMARRSSRTILVDVRVEPRYVQRFVYVSPTYRSSECWNTQVGDCLVRIYAGSEWTEPVRVLRSRGTTAAEIHDEQPERIPYRFWSSEGE